MNWIRTGLIVAGGAAAIGAAVFAVVKMNKNSIQKNAEKTVLKKAEEDFAACAGTFAGLYEPLYMMGKGNIKFRPGVIGDWVTRTENLSTAVNYREMWMPMLSNYTGWDQEQGLKKINELLSFILSAGVCRDTAAEITVGSATYKKYSTSDGEMIEAGNPARVKTPYWFIGDKILEKGVIEKI
jgi:hypothetical protein